MRTTDFSPYFFLGKWPLKPLLGIVCSLFRLERGFYHEFFSSLVFQAETKAKARVECPLNNAQGKMDPPHLACLQQHLFCKAKLKLIFLQIFPNERFSPLAKVMRSCPVVFVKNPDWNQMIWASPISIFRSCWGGPFLVMGGGFRISYEKERKEKTFVSLTLTHYYFMRVASRLNSFGTGRW